MSRSKPFAWYRVGLFVFVSLLAAVTFFALHGPEWFQRLYYPLSFTEEIADSAARHRVNPYLVAAVINEESGWYPNAESRVGATGLMQLMPDTAADMRERGIVSEDIVSGRPLTDPAANIEYGTAYLRHLVERYHEIEIALAAYNAGMRHADGWAREGSDIRDEITFPETRHFVVRVVRAQERYEALYPDAFPEWTGGAQ